MLMSWAGATRMSANDATEPGEEWVLIASMPNDLEAVERVSLLFIAAGIEPGGGGSRAFGFMVTRKHRALAESILWKDAKQHGYKVWIYSRKSIFRRRWFWSVLLVCAALGTVLALTFSKSSLWYGHR